MANGFYSQSLIILVIKSTIIDSIRKGVSILTIFKLIWKLKIRALCNIKLLCIKGLSVFHDVMFLLHISTNTLKISSRTFSKLNYMSNNNNNKTTEC